MRALRLHGIEDLRLHDEADPVAGPGETLVRVEAVGICGSDLHWFDQGGIGDAVVTTPLVLGHEMAGVALTGPLAGRLVAVDPAIPCGCCALCVEGHRNLCTAMRFAGHGPTDGSLRELMAWPSDLLFPLPDGLTAADGAVLEPLGVALHAWDLAHARGGATVAVVGCGPIGLLAIQLARHCGAGTIIAVEPLPHRRAAALASGAEVAWAPDEATAAAWRDAAGLGCHIVLECAGTNDAVATSLAGARPGGRVLLVGIPDDDTTTFPAALARRKGLTLVMVRRMKEMYERTIALVAGGHVDVRSIVTASYGLGEADAAFRTAVARDGLKVVINPNA